MRKPYEKELSNLNKTYQWALQQEVDNLKSYIDNFKDFPLLIVGYGESLAAANVITLLHQNKGIVSKAITPLEIYSSKRIIKNSNVLFLSASGQNHDILTSFDLVATSEPKNLLAICMQSNSPLANLSKKYRYVNLIGYDMPTGKDGFITTNSIMGLIIILIRAYRELGSNYEDLPRSLAFSKYDKNKLTKSVNPLLSKSTWVVLHGGWGLPAAMDFKSKLVESGLMNMQLIDYRNFIHGKLHWIAKSSHETGVLSLINPDEAEIAKETLALIPAEVSKCQIISKNKGPIGGVELFYQAQQIVNIIAKSNNIDPERTSVTSFGKRMYNINYSLNKSVHKSLFLKGINQREIIAIIRKCGISDITELNISTRKWWQNAYRKFIRKIRDATFSAIVFDYDGTLCDLKERFVGPPKEIQQEILRLLKGGILVGIATGRGDPVRIDLQRFIPKRYWNHVLIGYYNGSEIGLLNDMRCLKEDNNLDKSLQSIKFSIVNHFYLNQMAKFEFRKNYIFVKPHNLSDWNKITSILQDIINKSNKQNIKILESVHSMDIIGPDVSKLKLVAALENILNKNGNIGHILCIGDNGKWRGNDYGLLSQPYSLSVDSISLDENTCWNLSKKGHRGVQATLDYLSSIYIATEGCKIKFKKG